MEATPLPPVQPTEATKRRVMRVGRPKQSIPTDRMKWDVQVRVLQAFGRVSSAAKRPVSNEALSEAMNKEVSHYTVGLNHGFFADCGWLTRLTRGEYAAADALVAYTNHMSVGNEDAACEALRPSVLRSWFWKAIEPQARVGAPVSEVVVTLMQEAGVGSEHRPQLTNLLAWLRYVHLLTIDHTDHVRLVGDVPAAVADDDGEGTGPEAPTPEPESKPPAADGAGSTTRQPDGSPAPVVAFSVSVALTADDMARLEPEQISALFAGLAAVASIKNALS